MREDAIRTQRISRHWLVLPLHARGARFSCVPGATNGARPVVLSYVPEVTKTICDSGLRYERVSRVRSAGRAGGRARRRFPRRLPARRAGARGPREARVTISDTSAISPTS